MGHEARVYELDTDALLADLQELLVREGIDVREQVPTGVWWFHTEEAKEEVCRRTAALVGRVMEANLREVEQ